MAQLFIKELCAQKGITQKELAARIGLSTTSLSRIATGDQTPSLDTLEKVAGALGVPIAALFGVQDDFIAFIRLNGHTHTFTSMAELAKWVGGQH